MLYIIAGDHQQARDFIRRQNIHPKNCIVITTKVTLSRLRGRKWHDEDELKCVGTWWEHDYSLIRNELLLMGAPKGII